MIRLAILLIVMAIAGPAQARPWHWSGNTLVADGGWRWRMANNWEYRARSFRPGFGSPILVAVPSRRQLAIGAIYLRRNGVWSGYAWRPWHSYALSPQALAHDALCWNELRRVYGWAELPRRCWK